MKFINYQVKLYRNTVTGRRCKRVGVLEEINRAVTRSHSLLISNLLRVKRSNKNKTYLEYEIRNDWNENIYICIEKNIFIMIIFIYFKVIQK